MQFTTVRSKEKDYDIYLKSEKLVHSQQEHEKNVSNTVAAIWKWIPAIWRPKTGSQLYFSSTVTNTVASI